MNRKILIYIVCVFLANLGFALSDQCSKLPEVPRVAETDPPGKIIFRLDATENVTYTLTTVKPNYLKEYFRWYLNTNQTQYIMEVNMTLDLEEIRDKYGAKVGLVTIHMKCDVGSLPSSTLEGAIQIIEKNEFTPEFINAPYFLNVSESASVSTSIIKLRDHAFDRDVNLSLPEINKFDMVPYNNSTLDGRGMFKIANIQDGVIVVQKPLDYEQMKPGFNFYFVNVTVVDRKGLQNHTWIKITVVDEDDQDPEFYTPDCQLNCYTAYETDAEDTYTGTLKNLSPYSIMARDRDSLNYTIKFLLKGAIPSSATNYFTIDPNSGVVTVLKALKNTDESVASIVLFIEAREVSPSKRSTTTTLRVNILGRSTTSSPEPSTSASQQHLDDKTLLLVLIVLAAVLFIVIVAMVISLFCFKKKYKRSVAPEDSPSVSEASTDLDELSVDQWPVPYNSGKMETFRPQFDKTALKDSATETDVELAKKRRQRSRKTNKEPGIFDGTRQFEGVADLAFFTQKNKKKIKLSSRSRDHNTDPKYWITVDNDY